MLVSKEFLDNVLRKALRYDILEEWGLGIEADGIYLYTQAQIQWEAEEASDAADQ